MTNFTMNKINVNKWIQENQTQFVPPVCNKLMHNDQLTIMFVGGPNVRKDYHFEEGEELFYQIKGDMCLKIVEQNQHRDVIIKEGDIFLLPAYIPHSPNRFENTVGFVMERKREEKELDCLRYYKNNSLDPLFERWFHTTDLGIQLGPVIKEFFASEEYRTGEPKDDSFPKNPPLKNNEKITINNPFSLNEWIDKHKEDLSHGHPISLFPDQFQTRVYVISKGQHTIDCSNEYRTGEPKDDSFPKNPPLKNNEKIIINNPFSLNEWIDKHKEDLSHGHPISLFPDQFQTRVSVISKGQHTIDCSNGDVWLWQHKGHSTAKIITNDKQESVVDLEHSDSVYLNVHWT
ncbi:unnamed protein product [Adineta steineri]|uniref:3-hydroxyanthranilate 3,4-dioxygenase n=1 Tax=Adineta steineri TaxID=433720 RepID=A0A814J648_9BILA|nr:unnamed protein product [Adineta steineri]